MTPFFTKRELADTAYLLRTALEPDAVGDRTFERFRAIVIAPTARRIDRSWVEAIFQHAGTPLMFLANESNLFPGFARRQRFIDRLHGDEHLPDVCLWAFVWLATAHRQPRPWGDAALKFLWRHAGGPAIRDRMTLGDIWQARRRIVRRLDTPSVVCPRYRT